MRRRLLALFVYIVTVKLVILYPFSQYSNNRGAFHPLLVDTSFINLPNFSNLAKGFGLVFIVVVISRTIIYILRKKFSIKPLSNMEHIVISAIAGFISAIAAVLTIGYIDSNNSFSFVNGLNLFTIVIVGLSFMIIPIIWNTIIALALLMYESRKK